MKRHLTHLILTTTLIFLASCVSKSQYTKVNDELQMANQKQAQAEQELQTLKQTLHSTDAERKALAEQQETQNRLINSLRDEVKAGDVKISRLKERVTVELVDKVLFDSGKAEIRPQGEKTLDKVAAILKDTVQKDIFINGHTDDIPIGPSLAGKFETNWELSTARATAVVRYMIKKGVAEDKLAAAGYSKFRPIAPNDTPEGRKMNRRIEIVLMPKEVTTVQQLSSRF